MSAEPAQTARLHSITSTHHDHETRDRLNAGLLQGKGEGDGQVKGASAQRRPIQHKSQTFSKARQPLTATR